MSKVYSGGVRIGYSDTKAGSVTWVVGKLGSDSNINPENIQTETTTGAIYGGSLVNPSIPIMNRSDYATLEALMIADTEKFWHIDMVDRSYVSDVAINPFVVDNMGMNARNGVSPYTLSFTRVHTKPVFELKA